ncbi:MAG: class I SAM-dependent methyltransferase, partial [Bacillota bacterium]
MILSGRLKEIIGMVPEAKTVADIGCDHGKVAVSLVKGGKAQRAVCGDISGKSLDKARKLVNASGLSASVVLREGSGLSVLTAGEADVAVIAGMGGELIVRLLDEGADKAPGTLVLSCNKG